MSLRRPTQRRLALLLACATALAVSLVGCSGESPPPSPSTDASGASSQGWPRTIETDAGALTLTAKPERIVSTSTTLTGSLLAVGAPVVAAAATAPDIEGLSDSKGFFIQWSDAAATAGVEKLFENSSPNVEKVIEYDPDLIVVAETGGDSMMDSVDQLRKIAPVLVINYSGTSWEDVTRKLGEATGNEEHANSVIDTFDDRVATVKANISVPDDEVSALMVFGDRTGAAALTEESPHVHIMQELGFSMAPIPDEVKGDTSMGGAERKDIVTLSLENVQRGLPGATWIVVAADEASRALIKDDPAFNTAPAVVNGRVYYTPGETFRLDYFSAMALVDSLNDSFKK